MRTLIDFEHVFHRRDQLGAARGRHHPLLFLPRLEFVFLSVWRTASWQIVSTISNSTSRAASSRSIQRALHPQDRDPDEDVARGDSAARDSVYHTDRGRHEQ